MDYKQKAKEKIIKLVEDFKDNLAYYKKLSEAEKKIIEASSR